MKGWDVPGCTTVLLHEVWHLLRNHAARAKAQGIIAQGGDAWNVATDAEINDGLEKGPWPAGLTPVTPTALKLPSGLLAEEYYAKLPKQTSYQSSGSGSGSDGVPRPWEDGKGPGKDGEGKPKLDKGARAIKGDLIRKQVAEEISKAAGNMPDTWKRWAGTTLAPRIIPWQTILRQVVGTIMSGGVRDDFTFAKANRRQGAAEVIFPGTFSTLPSILVACDTSGSMGQGDLAECLRIIESVLGYLGRTEPIRVIAGDTCVHETTLTLSGRRVNLTGGGGTDMGALIAYAEKARPRPQVCVVVTDGFTPWPRQAPTMQTVVVLTQPNEVPGWAKVVRAYVKDAS
jgi:predicted metal-dependent peptidase